MQRFFVLKAFLILSYAAKIVCLHFVFTCVQDVPALAMTDVDFRYRISAMFWINSLHRSNWKRLAHQSRCIARKLTWFVAKMGFSLVLSVKRDALLWRLKHSFSNCVKSLHSHLAIQRLSAHLSLFVQSMFVFQALARICSTLLKFMRKFFANEINIRLVENDHLNNKRAKHANFSMNGLLGSAGVIACKQQCELVFLSLRFLFSNKKKECEKERNRHNKYLE